jgi:hypothetical protein
MNLYSAILGRRAANNSRLGELLKAMEQSGQRAKAGEPKKQETSRGVTSAPPTLKDLGIPGTAPAGLTVV